MKRWFLIIMALSSFGCTPANLPALHNSAPILSLRSSKPPEQLSNCVLYEAKNYKSSWLGVPHMTLINREGVYYLLMEGGLGYPFAEVSFSPTHDGGSNVEYRNIDYGASYQTCRFIWDYVEKCK
jgi:hypothetical protein